MANFNTAIEIILKHEGGFVFNKNDKGGATHLGVTFKLFKEYADALGLPKTVEGLKALTRDQAKFIYREHFWDVMRGDEWKDQQLATLVFDGFVNMWTKSIKIIQVQAGVRADGVVGPNTLAIINAANPRILFEGYKDERIKRYEKIVEEDPTQNVFLKGWKNRVNSFVYQ